MQSDSQPIIDRARSQPSLPATARPIFIVGHERSGTTLIATIIDRHSQIVISPETHLFSALSIGIIPAHGIPHEEFLLRLQSAYRHWQEPPLNDPELLAAFRNRPPTAQNLLETIFEFHGRKYGASRFGEKTPGHVNQLPQIIKWYPDAKIIAIVRDGRDVVRSLMNMKWAHNNYVRHCLSWCQTCRVLSSAKSKLGDQFFLLRFEDLLEQPEIWVERICHHLDVRFESTMLEPSGSRKSAPTVPRWELDWKGGALEPLDVRRIAAWRRDEDPARARLGTALMYQQLEKFGYLNDEDRLTSAERMWTRLRHPLSIPPVYQLLRMVKMSFNWLSRY